MELLMKGQSDMQPEMCGLRFICSKLSLIAGIRSSDIPSIVVFTVL